MEKRKSAGFSMKMACVSQKCCLLWEKGRIKLEKGYQSIRKSPWGKGVFKTGRSGTLCIFNSLLQNFLCYFNEQVIRNLGKKARAKRYLHRVYTLVSATKMHANTIQYAFEWTRDNQTKCKVLRVKNLFTIALQWKTKMKTNKKKKEKRMSGSKWD